MLFSGVTVFGRAVIGTRARPVAGDRSAMTTFTTIGPAGDTFGDEGGPAGTAGEKQRCLVQRAPGWSCLAARTVQFHTVVVVVAEEQSGTANSAMVSRAANMVRASVKGTPIFRGRRN